MNNVLRQSVISKSLFRPLGSVSLKFSDEERMLEMIIIWGLQGIQRIFILLYHPLTQRSTNENDVKLIDF